MLLVIYPYIDLWNYMLQDYKVDSDIKIRGLNRYAAKWQQIIRKLFNHSRLPLELLVNSNLITDLRSLEEGDTLLICDYADEVLSKSIAKVVSSKVKKYFWIWNPVLPFQQEIYERQFITLKKENFILSTFDKQDANKYGMKLCNQFFRMEKGFHIEEEKYDFYFLGFAKNREKEILQLYDQLSCYNNLFKIVYSNKEAITYTENIENIKKSKCLVEIVQSGQEGITLRPLEAISFKKKLISNNEKLTQYDFYHKENIFILGKDDISTIGDFLNSKFVEIDVNTVNKYNVYNWLKHFT